MTRSIDREPTLYELIGLSNFSPCFDVLARQESFVEINEGTSAGDDSLIQLAFDVLSKPEMKQRYDRLLEAQLREDHCLAPILSPSERAEIYQLAVKLNIQLEQQTETVFRIVTSRQSVVPAIPCYDRHSTSVGSATIHFFATKCEVVLSPVDYRPVLVSEIDDSKFLSLHSNVTKTIVRAGDNLKLVTVGDDDQPIGYQAAYINESQSAFGILEAAPHALFNGTPETVAERFATRCRPDRLNELVKSYFAGLADAINAFDAEIGQKLANEACLKFAKQHGPRF